MHWSILVSSDDKAALISAMAGWVELSLCRVGPVGGGAVALAMREVGWSCLLPFPFL